MPASPKDHRSPILMKQPSSRIETNATTMLLPAIFFGHGNPLNAIASNAYTQAWRRIGIDTPRPRDPVDLRALVCTRNGGHHIDGSKDDS